MCNNHVENVPFIDCKTHTKVSCLCNMLWREHYSCSGSFADVLPMLKIVGSIVDFVHLSLLLLPLAALVGFSYEKRVCPGINIPYTLLSLQILLNHVEMLNMQECQEEHCGLKKKIMVPHFFGFICLVLEVLFLRTGKGRKLETDPPTLESLSTKSVQRMRRHTTTVPHCNTLLKETNTERQTLEKDV